MIREMILENEIASNEQINEVQLAKDLKVSRGPIREAIRQLEKEGLLIRRNNLLYVYRTSREDLSYIYQVRTALESLAVSLAVKNKDEDLISKLDLVFREKAKLLKRDETEDVSKLFSIECSKFHDLILQCCDNPRLVEQINHLRSLTRFYMNTKLRNSERRKQIYYEHKEIFDEIKNSNSKKACRLMEEHMNKDLKYLLDNF